MGKIENKEHFLEIDTGDSDLIMNNEDLPSNSKPTVIKYITHLNKNDSCMVVRKITS